MPTTQMWLMLAVNPLTQVVPKIGKLWSDGLANNAEKMDDRRKTSIPDEFTYQSKLAGPSELEYRRLIDPTFVSRKGRGKNAINARQADNIKAAWAKYQQNWDYQFGTLDGVPAKRFKDKVSANANIYADRASKTSFALTGLKALESGPARITVYYLSGDSRAKGLLRPADREMLPSFPFNITTIAKRNSLRALLMPRLVQSGTAILRSGLSDTLIASMNTLDNELVQGLIDPSLGLVGFTPGAESHLDFVKENGQLFLSVKVTQS